MTLWESLENIEDWRNASGRRFTLGSILKLIVCGLFSGRRSLSQITLWGRSLPPKARDVLGFTGPSPCVATLSNILRKLDVEKIEASLSSYLLEGKPLLPPGTHLALDGKTLRASHEPGVPLVHLLSVFVVNLEGVLGQTKMTQGENEILAALRLLKDLPLEGAILTGDAIFAQKKSAL